MNDILIVKNSRYLILLLILVSLIFLITGTILPILYWYNVIYLESAKIWIFVLFEVFAIGAGGMIFVSQVINFFRPFVMLKVDQKGISFGTSWRYVPYLIEWKYVREVRVESNSGFWFWSWIKNCDNLWIEFEQSQEIPSAMATSAGIMYGGYQLRLDGNYTDVPALVAEEWIKKIIATKNCN